MTKHLTPADLAERLGVTERTLSSWRLSGVGPRFMKMPAGIRYRVPAVIEWEDSRECLTILQAHDKQNSQTRYKA
jgi:transcriptional regulator with XRE-family HTH domain